MNLKRAPAIPFENHVNIAFAQRNYLQTHCGRENLIGSSWDTNWESKNVSYYIKRMLMYYVKFPLFMYNDASYWSMFDDVNIILTMTPSREKAMSVQANMKKHSRIVMRLFVSDLCLCLSHTPLPSVLVREVAGYLFGDMNAMFPAPKKEVLRVHRAVKTTAQAAVKAATATNKKRRKP
jgi:hypothetical protein